MRKYEVIFIVRPLEDEATEAVIGKFSKLIANNGGTIDKEDRWITDDVLKHMIVKSEGVEGEAAKAEAASEATAEEE